MDRFNYKSSKCPKIFFLKFGVFRAETNPNDVKRLNFSHVMSVTVKV